MSLSAQPRSATRTAAVHTPGKLRTAGAIKVTAASPTKNDPAHAARALAAPQVDRVELRMGIRVVSPRDFLDPSASTVAAPLGYRR